MSWTQFVMVRWEAYAGSVSIRLHEWRGLPELSLSFFVDRGTVLGLVVRSPEPALEAVLSDASIVDPSSDKRSPFTSKGDPPRLWTRAVSLESLQLIVLYHWMRAPNRPFRVCQ